jgi:hypothetical protein
MKKVFVDSIANSHEEFLACVTGSAAVFYEVYDGIPNSDFEAKIEQSASDELLLRFDMSKHSQDGRSRFCSLNDFDRKMNQITDEIDEFPLPYFGSFIRSYGWQEAAWTAEGVDRLIARSREERACLAKIWNRPQADGGDTEAAAH